eukprot:7945372-Heterocapsa_arctica.AAC.1
MVQQAARFGHRTCNEAMQLSHSLVLTCMSVDFAAYQSQPHVLNFPWAARMFRCGSGWVHCSACHDSRLDAQC